MDVSLPDLRDLERRLDRLSGLGQSLSEEHVRAGVELAEVHRFLEVAPKAQDTLEELSTALFGKVLDEIEANLTHAIREVLGQDRVVRTQREVKNNRLQVHFQIHNQGRDEEIEDILAGQGGSVANILSVGLRLIALSQLSAEQHRPFLVLDEQDCWLKPGLVPRFMKLVGEIAHKLDLQILVISHHPVDLFAQSADSILELAPHREQGAVIRQMK